VQFAVSFHLGFADRVTMFWKRRGAAPERTTGAVKSAVKRFLSVYKNPPSGTAPPAENGTQTNQEEKNHPLDEKR
jgi:hypothetical protein